MAKTNVRGLKGRKQVYHAVYDFSVDGGLFGAGNAIELFSLAAGTILHDSWMEVEAAVVGTSSTVEVADVLASTAEATLVSDFVSGAAELGTDLVGGLRAKKTAATVLSMEIGTANLTAGKVHFYVECSDGY